MIPDDEIRRLAADPDTQSPLSGVTAKHGLLYRRGIMLHVEEADLLAQKSGLWCAEQLVRILAVPVMRVV